MKEYNIIAIVGSLRQNSFNRQLAQVFAKFLAGSAKLQTLDYADVPFFNEDIEYPAPEAVARVRQTVKSADGICFFSPEYNHFFSGALKNLIDWLSRPPGEGDAQVLKGKPAAVSGISLGMSGAAIAQDHLVSLISFLDMKVMNQPRVAVPSAAGQVGADGKLVLAAASAQFLEKQAQAFLAFIRAG